MSDIQDSENLHQSICEKRKQSIMGTQVPEQQFLKTLQKKHYESPFSFIIENKVTLNDCFNDYFITQFQIYEMVVNQDSHRRDDYLLQNHIKDFGIIYDHLNKILEVFRKIVKQYNRKQQNSINDFTYRHFSQDDLVLRRLINSFLKSFDTEHVERKVTFDDQPKNFAKARKTLKCLWEQLFVFFQNNNKEHQFIEQEKIQETIQFIEILNQNCKEIFEVISKEYENEHDRKFEFTKYDMFTFDQDKRRTSKPIFDQTFVKDGEFYFNSTIQQHKPIVMQNSFDLKFNVKLSEINFQQIQPVKHRSYVTQACQQIKRVVPVKLFNFFCDQKKNTIDITQKDYFEPDCQQKILYYFEPGTKIMWAYDLLTVSRLSTQNKEQSMKIELKINFKFSEYNRSVITPSGQLFLFSGKQVSQDQFDDSVMEFDFNENEFIERKRKMPVPKRNYSTIYMNNKIYVIGGETQDSKCSNTCEVYDLKTRKWDRIASLNEGVINPLIIQQDDKYLFRFSGLNRFGYIDKTIERYNSFTDQWDEVQYASLNPDEEIQILTNSLGCQIDDDRLLVFGGYNQNEFKQDTSFLFEDLGENKSLTIHKLTAEMKSLDMMPRTVYSYSGQMNNERTIIFNGCLYFLRKEYF